MLFYILAITLIFADQLTKLLTLKYLKPIGSSVIADGILSFTYVENRGAAFGILQDARWVFIVATIAILCAIIYFKIKYKPAEKTLNSSLCLLTAGAVGNLIDRIFRGYVVDMIEVTFINYPVFNVADCFVVTGAALLAIYIIFIYKEPKKNDE